MAYRLRPTQRTTSKSISKYSHTWAACLFGLLQPDCPLLLGAHCRAGLSHVQPWVGLWFSRCLASCFFQGAQHRFAKTLYVAHWLCRYLKSALTAIKRMRTTVMCMTAVTASSVQL